MSHFMQSASINTETRFYDTCRFAAPPPAFRDFFQSHYAAARAAALQATAPGYLVIAGLQQQLTQVAFVRERSPEGRGDALVIGRHTQCGLRMALDPRVALRHLLIRSPAEPEQRARLHLLDLGTGQGFELDGIGSVEAAVIDGPAYFTLGAYGVVVLPVGAGHPWPDDADEAWRLLPPRRIVDQRHCPHREHRLAPHTPEDEQREFTRITLVPPASTPFASALPYPLDNAYGTAVLRSALGEVYLMLSAAQLESGVLFGRYERCDVQLDPMQSDVSRVHVLLLKEGARLFCFDTASTHGVSVDGMLCTVSEIEHGSVMKLGMTCQLRWQRRPGGG